MKIHLLLQLMLFYRVYDGVYDEPLIFPPEPPRPIGGSPNPTKIIWSRQMPSGQYLMEQYDKRLNRLQSASYPPSACYLPYLNDLGSNFYLSGIDSFGFHDSSGGSPIPTQVSPSLSISPVNPIIPPRQTSKQFGKQPHASHIKLFK